jgi:UDP-2,4-diacetamido-2,4,6-trideoxy-beta-L-altropyranose hydrolase
LSSNKELFIRADANSKIGIGHLMRCIALAQQSRKQGWNVTFLSNIESDLLISRIRDEGFQLVFIEKSYPNPIDLETTMLNIANSPSINKLIVLDGYNFDISYQTIVKNKGNQLFVIDDTAHQKQYVADIILNQNIIATELSYSCDPDTKLLLGTDYVLLRDEFLLFKHWKREIPKIAKKVLVIMGGGDIYEITSKVLKAFNDVDIASLEIKVLVGTSNEHTDEINHANDSNRHSIDFVQNVTSIPKLMAWADFAISSAGSTCWELAYFGLPMILIITSLNQKKNLDFLEKVGVATSPNNEINPSIDKIVNKIQKLIMNNELRNEMSNNGKLLVDGNGSKRVVKQFRLINKIVKGQNERENPAVNL